MDILSLAFLGGIFSLTSTSAGSMLAPLFSKIERLRKYHLSMDFALGVMLSAVAFSLVGPELINGHNHFMNFSGLFLGMGFIYFTHKIIENLNHDNRFNSYKVLLIAALFFHNLPEGMGAGASLAGMKLQQAIPLQVAISVQNVAEGLLLTLLLQSMGLSLFRAVLAGIGSGIIEMSGAITAGYLLEVTQAFLPFLLTLAGGAMMMSVILEFVESKHIGRTIKVQHLFYGLLTIPISNLLVS
jgi:zinc transporter, ZIP family